MKSGAFNIQRTNMNDKEVYTLKTDVALIKKDIRQIERVFDKVDGAVSDMSELHKVAAVQETILDSAERRLQMLEETISKQSEEELAYRKELRKSLEDMQHHTIKERDRRHREVLDSIESMHTTLAAKLDKQDKRVRALENWRWYILGASGGLVFLLTKYNLITAFFS